MSTAKGAVVALTFVLVLSYGLFSLKDHSIYAVGSLGSSLKGAVAQRALPAAVGTVADTFLSRVEDMVAPELVYHRK